MGIEIINGKVFVEGVETVDPELIGYAVLDLAEHFSTIQTTSGQHHFNLYPNAAN